MTPRGEDDEFQFGEFERHLLTRARCDSRNPDVHGAWQRFSGQLTGMAAAIEPMSGVHSLNGACKPSTALGPSHTSELTAPSPALPATAPKWVAARWLAIGAIGGSSLTAAVFISEAPRNNPGQASEATAQAPAVADTVADTVAAELAPPSPLAGAGPVSEYDAIPQSRAAEMAQRGGAPSASHAAGDPEGQLSMSAKLAQPDAPSRRTHRAQNAPSIAAEVRALDEARAASSRGEYERCFALVERFGKNYPKSALLPDAEVLAVEALEAIGQDAAAARRANSFLKRRPADPHVARVRAVLERTASPR